MHYRSPEGTLVNRSADAAVLSRRRRTGARYAARRDARDGTRIGVEQTADGGRAAYTPYLEENRHASDRAVTQVVAMLLRENGCLIREIHARAAAVVHHHDVLGQHDTVHHRRFADDLSAWFAVTQAAALHADAVVAMFNQTIVVYWGELGRRHPALREDTHHSEINGLRPAPIVRNIRWSHPLDLIPPLPPRAHDTRPQNAMNRAIRIVAMATTS